MRIFGTIFVVCVVVSSGCSVLAGGDRMETRQSRRCRLGVEALVRLRQFEPNQSGERTAELPACLVPDNVQRMPDQMVVALKVVQELVQQASESRRSAVFLAGWHYVLAVGWDIFAGSPSMDEESIRQGARYFVLGWS